MEPSIGRIVWFDGGVGKPIAAMIVAVHGGGMVSLRLFPDAPPGFLPEYQANSPYSDLPNHIGSWCWPPRTL